MLERIYQFIDHVMCEEYKSEAKEIAKLSDENIQKEILEEAIEGSEEGSMNGFCMSFDKACTILVKKGILSSHHRFYDPMWNEILEENEKNEKEWNEFEKLFKKI